MFRCLGDSLQEGRLIGADNDGAITIGLYKFKRINDAIGIVMHDMMMVHANAPYQLNIALRAALEPSDGSFADIIHMTDYVQETGSENHIAYAASKAALHNLTLSFARIYSPQIKVNSIAPSLVMFNEDDTEAYREKSLNKSLLRIVPGAQEAVKAVNYLLDSEYVTGQTLHLNGGRNLK